MKHWNHRRFVRQPNREHPLVVALLERMGKPHAWGSMDCWSLVVTTVSILGGVSEDELSKGIPPYSNLKGAIMASSATGGIAAKLRTWGLTTLSHSYPCLGDIVVSKSDAPFEAATIAMGNGRYLGVTEGDVVGWVTPSGDSTIFRLE